MSFKYLLFGITFIYFFIRTTNQCSTGDSGVSPGEASRIVALHNEVREKIMNGEVPGQPRGEGLKTLAWDSRLADEAQSLAETCIFEHNDVYDSRFHVGQNLYMTQGISSYGADWESAVHDWYDEYRLYTFGEGFSYAAGHYTQLVWGDTEYVGCGYTTSGSGYSAQKLYVCNYGPAGNVLGESPYQTAYRRRRMGNKSQKNRKNRKNQKNKKSNGSKKNYRMRLKQRNRTTKMNRRI